ncbi:hypothetical protein FKM82_008630 [Ascaphus truei]
MGASVGGACQVAGAGDRARVRRTEGTLGAAGTRREEERRRGHWDTICWGSERERRWPLNHPSSRPSFHT